MTCHEEKCVICGLVPLAMLQVFHVWQDGNCCSSHQEPSSLNVCAVRRCSWSSCFWESPCTPTSFFLISCCLVLYYHVLFPNWGGWTASQAVAAGSHLQCGRQRDVWRLLWWAAEIHCTLRAVKWMGCTSALSTFEVSSMLRYSSPDSGSTSIGSSHSFAIVFCEGRLDLLRLGPQAVTWLCGSTPW